MAYADGSIWKGIRRITLAGSALTLMLAALNTAALATPPTISCIGGISTGTTCFCRPPTEKVQTGPNSYRCVMGGLSTGAGHGGPFVNRLDNRPRIMVGPAPAQGSQPPFARPMFNRQSALPPHGMIR